MSTLSKPAFSAVRVITLFDRTMLPLIHSWSETRIHSQPFHPSCPRSGKNFGYLTTITRVYGAR